MGQAVNASGQVAGVSYFANGTFHAFLTEASGRTMHDLGTLIRRQQRGVGRQRQGAGRRLRLSASSSDAFLYSNGKMVDLNTLVASMPGVHLTRCPRRSRTTATSSPSRLDANGLEASFAAQGDPRAAEPRAARARRRRPGAFGPRDGGGPGRAGPVTGPFPFPTAVPGRRTSTFVEGVPRFSFSAFIMEDAFPRKSRPPRRRAA